MSRNLEELLAAALVESLDVDGLDKLPQDVGGISRMAADCPALRLIRVALQWNRAISHPPGI